MPTKRASKACGSLATASANESPRFTATESRPMTGPSAVEENCDWRLESDLEMSTPALRYEPNCRQKAASWPELTRPKKIRSHHDGPFPGSIAVGIETAG